jgi:hypothetical protein
MCPYPWRFTHSPDGGNKLYTIDGSAIGEHDNGGTLNEFTNSYEVHQNYKDYVYWNGTLCSGTNNYWHFQAGINKTNTPLIQHTDLGGGLIVPLPISPEY